MERYEVENLYDRLCFALSAYEADTTDQEYDRGQALYEDIIAIVEEFEAKLN